MHSIINLCMLRQLQWLMWNFKQSLFLQEKITQGKKTYKVYLCISLTKQILNNVNVKPKKLYLVFHFGGTSNFIVNAGIVNAIDNAIQCDWPLDNSRDDEMFIAVYNDIITNVNAEFNSNSNNKVNCKATGISNGITSSTLPMERVQKDMQ